MTEAILDNKIEAAEEIQPEKPKPYTFRQLEADDIFLMCNLINAIGIKEFKALFADGGFKKMFAEMMNNQGGEEGEAGKTINDVIVEVGLAVFLDIAEVIFRNLPKCRKEIYQLLAAVSDLSEDQISKLGFADFFQMVVDFVKKEEFRDFIQVVSKLF